MHKIGSNFKMPQVRKHQRFLLHFRLLTCTTNVQSLKIFTSVKTRLPPHRSCDWTFIHSKKSLLELDKSQSNSFVKAGKSSHLTRSSSNLEVFESRYCHTRPPLTLHWTLLARGKASFKIIPSSLTCNGKFSFSELLFT